MWRPCGAAVSGFNKGNCSHSNFDEPQSFANDGADIFVADTLYHQVMRIHNMSNVSLVSGDEYDFE